MLAHSMMKYIYSQQQISMMHSKNIQLYTHGVLSWQNRKSMRVRGSINPRIGLYFLSPGFLKNTGDWWYCALCEEGRILFTGGGYTTEEIPGAGVNRSDSVGWGYLSDIQQIGDHLYACGYSGQVYKRWGIKRLAAYGCGLAARS